MASELTPEQAKQAWLSLLRKLELEKGNAVLATLEAKRQRPDLWRAFMGLKADSGQMELFGDEQTHNPQNAREREPGGKDAKR